MRLGEHETKGELFSKDVESEADVNKSFKLISRYLLYEALLIPPKIPLSPEPSNSGHGSTCLSYSPFAARLPPGVHTLVFQK
jgi:hypothetical protein